MQNVTIITKRGMRSMALNEYRDAMPVPEGYESSTPLAWPKSRNVADQTREMGLSVGDAIIGREGDDGVAWWHEARLTLLWVGKSAAVFREERREKNAPKWKDDGEASNWTLDARKWFLANDKFRNAGLMAPHPERQLENENNLMRAKVSDAIAWLAFYGPVGATPHAAKLMENELRSAMANAGSEPHGQRENLNRNTQ